MRDGVRGNAGCIHLDEGGAAGAVSISAWRQPVEVIQRTGIHTAPAGGTRSDKSQFDGTGDIRGRSNDHEFSPRICRAGNPSVIARNIWITVVTTAAQRNRQQLIPPVP
jgi:hypothetical protein